ncbi:kinesin-like protein KIF14 [Amia ocellicauda]|uniref:kinesin-like protein KIF14 n=1 Tax=Amia ocellicauda TaxID=2972642 RepID=UPI00346474E0
MCDRLPSSGFGSKRPLKEFNRVRSVFDKEPMDVFQSKGAKSWSLTDLRSEKMNYIDRSSQSTVPFSPEKTQVFSVNSPVSSSLVLQSTLLPQTQDKTSIRDFLRDFSALSYDETGSINRQECIEPVKRSLSASQLLPLKKFKSTAFFVVSNKKAGEKSPEENQGDHNNGADDFQATKRPALQLKFTPPFGHVQAQEKKEMEVDVLSPVPLQRFHKSRLPVSARQRTSLPSAPNPTRVSGAGRMLGLVNEDKFVRGSLPGEEEGGIESAGATDLPSSVRGENRDHIERDHVQMQTRSIVSEFMKEASSKVISAPQRLSHIGLEARERFNSTEKDRSHVGENTAVTVAIRVRPLNVREQRLNAKSVVTVSGQEAVVHHNQQKFSFSFDFAFWSCDDQMDTYASQDIVYSKLAQPLLDKVIQGYNTCLFAYGQTGSGKSYTMMGYGDEVGIIPRFCEEIFLKSSQEPLHNVTCHLEMSYFEVYNEKIHDLLSSDKEPSQKKTSLRVREHPELGPYVAGLSSYVVGSFADVQAWLELGNKQRATAATGMNDKSSRSHSVFTVVLTQTKREEVEGVSHDHTVRSHINLVDLAGSERSTAAHTTGIRLKEGASINKSLMTLGKVICALSEASQSKKKAFIPYRDSVLTWLLKESLGGNSKTAMIAAVSPAAVNIEETLSTLRYATQARRIINVAKVNEDSSARIIRELKAEIEKLRTAGRCSQGMGAMEYDANLQEILSLKEKLLQQERELTQAQEEWKVKLALAEQCKMEEAEGLQKAGVSFKVDNRFPYLVNLNEDPQLSEMLLYIIKEGQMKVGRLTAGSKYDIQLTGALIAEQHCLLTNTNGNVTLTPVEDAKTYINGVHLTQPVTLHHGDRVVLGGDHYFRFNHSVEQSGYRASEAPGGTKDVHRDFEFAKNELLDAQKQRIEAEIEEARQQAQQELMQELQTARELAQQELSAQRRQYEDHIRELQREMEEELNMKQDILTQEVEQRRRTLQIYLTGPFTQELEACGLRHHKLMEALQQEKEKLTQEVEKVQQARASKEEERRRAFIQGQSQWGSLRLSVLLQEANTISRTLNKQTTFTRYETVSVEEVPAVNVRVTNKKLGISTLWSLQKFEGKLVSMRELYQGKYEGNEDVLFYDPSDTWDKEVQANSPRRRRSSLGRQLSEQLMIKVFQDEAPAVGAGCVIACKRLIQCVVEGLQKQWEATTLTDQLLLDLQAVIDSIKIIAESYTQLQENSPHTVFKSPDIQNHCLTAATSMNRFMTTLQLWGTCIPEATVQSTVLNGISAQLKLLGGNLMLFLHGCESDIESMVAESRDKMAQSALAIASQLGRLVVSMEPEVRFTMAEKCGPEQAEQLGNTLKEAFVQGANRSIDGQIAAGIAELESMQLQIQNIPLEKMEEKKTSVFCAYLTSLRLLIDGTNLCWKEIQCLKNSKSESIQDTFFKEYLMFCTTLNLKLNELAQAGKGAFAFVTEPFKEEAALQMLKQMESLPNSIQTLLETLGSGWSAVNDESQDPTVADRWSALNNEVEKAARQLNSSAQDLRKLLERQRGVDSPNGAEGARRYKRQLPITLSVKPKWGRSGTPVREVIVKLNCQPLTREAFTIESKMS